LVLADVASSGGAFRRYFKYSAHPTIDIFVTALFNVAVAVIVHLLARHGNDHFGSWRAAGVARVRNPSSPGPAQIELPMTATDENIRMIQVRHMSIFAMCYAAQLTAVIWWMSWIAKVVGNA